MDSTSSRTVMPLKAMLMAPKDHHHCRNSTFQERKKSLKKKVEELTVLCDIDACLVCFVPPCVAPNSAKTNNTSNRSCSKSAAKQDKTQNQQDVEMWPGLAKVQEMVAKYRALTPEEQNRKKLDVSAFLALKIDKLNNLLSAKMKENEDLQMQISYHSQEQFFSQWELHELKMLLQVLDLKIQAVHGRIQTLHHHQQQQIQGLDFNNVPNIPCNNNVGFNLNSQFLHAMNSRSSSNANHNNWTPYNMTLQMPLPHHHLLQQHHHHHHHAQQMLIPSYGYPNNNNNNTSNNLVQHSSGYNGGTLVDTELLMDSQLEDFSSTHSDVDL